MVASSPIKVTREMSFLQLNTTGAMTVEDTGRKCDKEDMWTAVLYNNVNIQ